VRFNSRVGGSVIGTFIDAVNWDLAIGRIQEWALSSESRYVCICNAHSVVTASLEPEFHRVLAEADMATPDGAPVAWLLRRIGFANQARVNGPDLMLRYCAVAERAAEPIFLYGATQTTLDLLEIALMNKFPRLVIAGKVSPPFRELSMAEDDAIIAKINSSGAKTVWVSLGCPKQEKWMHEHRGRVAAVMIGVGAAFDYHAGTIKRAPLWFQRNGLEWLHRLCSEPKRLWKRYLVTNTIFVAKAAKQLFGTKSN
jgi:N-acetylglucosaminyldiphosphoundecaprenol N-acetyl-beta-D-mannosaminyltransferase